MKPLFIPLKKEYYLAFLSGDKTEEFRIYGPRWNERTCPVGRRVIIAKGYGKKHRRNGAIVGFRTSTDETTKPAWIDCYGSRPGRTAACIRIQLDLAT